MKSLLLVLALVLPLAAQDPLGNPTKVDDNSKTSSRIGDMITTAEQAKKAVDIYNTGAGAIDAAKKAEKLKQGLEWADAKKKIAGSIKNKVLVYKSTKMGFNKWLNEILNKTSTAANRRVNMWRTTEPMLEYYGKRMVRMADNTVEVFADFRPKDLIDIDRKWSREMEGQLYRDRATALNFNAFLKARAHDIEFNQQMFAGLFFDNDMYKVLTRDEKSLKAMLEMKDSHPFRAVPFNTLGYCTEAVNTLQDLTYRVHGPSKQDPGTTQETYDFSKIQEVLEDKNQTAEDTRSLSALIERRRAEIAVQRAEVEQINSMLQARYSRLLLRNVEQAAMQHEDYAKSLEVIASGKTGMISVDEHRQKVFGTSAP